MPTNCYRHILSFVLCINLWIVTKAQELVIPRQQQDSVVSLSTKQLSQYTNSIDKKAQSVSDKLAKTNTKALKDLVKQEQRLQKKLARVDSSLTKRLFDPARTSLKTLTDKVNSRKGQLDKLQQLTGSNKEYLPLLDTFSTSLKFLDSKALNNSAIKAQTDKALGSIKGLNNQLQNATDIKAYIKERKQALKAAFEEHGMGKELQALNKQAYYYGQQVSEYKQLLKDPKKLEERAIAELTKSALFKDFMQKNSQLASLFRVPDNYGTPQALAGLQTRASVNQLLQARLGNLAANSPTGNGANPQQYLQQQVQAAQGELNKLKEKISKIGGGSSDIEMPDFKPNTQKTKSFLTGLNTGWMYRPPNRIVCFP